MSVPTCFYCLIQSEGTTSDADHRVRARSEISSCPCLIRNFHILCIPFHIKCLQRSPCTVHHAHHASSNSSIHGKRHASRFASTQRSAPTDRILHHKNLKRRSAPLWPQSVDTLPAHSSTSPVHPASNLGEQTPLRSRRAANFDTLYLYN